MAGPVAADRVAAAGTASRQRPHLCEERAALEARRELALQPEKVPEPPLPDPNDQIVKDRAALCGMAGAAASSRGRSYRRSTRDWRGMNRRARLHGKSGRVAPAQPASPPAAIAARLDGNAAAHGRGQEFARRVTQGRSAEPREEPRREAILGVPAALAAGAAAAEAIPAIALDPPKAEGTPPSLIIRQMDRDELAFLVRRGEIFINSGDVAAARLMLQRAAEAGDVHAALALASTYDPNTIQKLGIQGLAADEAMARLWYERAAQFGSPEAPQRLQQLANQTSTLP